MNKEIIKKDLHPLYRDMLVKNTTQKPCIFCIQWGECYPDEKERGIIFVGKACNGWYDKSDDVDILFGDSENRIFALDDQMKWVKDREGGKAENKYNTNKSAFWRVIKKVSQKYYPEDSWYSHVAWSNLYKLSKGEGNPTKKYMNEQYESCLEIYKKEIEIFSPKFVVMFTSGWEDGFLKYLNEGKSCECIESINWGHMTNLYKINGVYFIATQHPQGKIEDKHVDVITRLINKYK